MQSLLFQQTIAELQDQNTNVQKSQAERPHRSRRRKCSAQERQYCKKNGDDDPLDEKFSKGQINHLLSYEWKPTLKRDSIPVDYAIPISPDLLLLEVALSYLSLILFVCPSTPSFLVTFKTIAVRLSFAPRA